jgi:hypothetical protein
MDVIDGVIAQVETNTSIRLCLFHDWSPGQSGTPITCTTPKPSVRRQLISPQTVIEIPADPGPTGNISMSGVRTVVATDGHMSGVRTGSATVDTRGNTVPPVLGTLPILLPIPMTGNSFDLVPAIPGIRP